MAKAKEDTRRIDANGCLHKEFADGRTEMYYNWQEDESQNFIEITDATDESVNRRRFIPSKKQTVEDGLLTRDEAVPGIDYDNLDIE